MEKYFLGVDVGSSKTHAVLADESGQALGFGRAGAGNHEVVGYAGLAAALQKAVGEALTCAKVAPAQVAGAGFGVAGYDWPCERAATLQAIAPLGLPARVAAVNDAVLGILAGSPEGWGITVVSGTGCNCWGWDRERRRVGQVTGCGISMGEGAGASELVFKAIHAVAHEWSRRGPATALSAAFIHLAGVNSLQELLEGLTMGQIEIGPSAAPLIFQAARDGDGVAGELVRWAGRELGELVKCVARQLEFERTAFDLVTVGSLFHNGRMLTDPLLETVHTLAPGARLVALQAPPVVGAVLLGMETCGLAAGWELRERLEKSMVGLSGA